MRIIVLPVDGYDLPQVRHARMGDRLARLIFLGFEAHGFDDEIADFAGLAGSGLNQKVGAAWSVRCQGIEHGLVDREVDAAGVKFLLGAQNRSEDVALEIGIDGREQPPIEDGLGISAQRRVPLGVSSFSVQ